MIVFKDAKRDSLKKAVKLMAHNDLELVADGNPRFSFETIQDDCQVRKILLITHYVLSNKILIHRQEPR